MTTPEGPYVRCLCGQHILLRRCASALRIVSGTFGNFEGESAYENSLPVGLLRKIDKRL